MHVYQLYMKVKAIWGNDVSHIDLDESYSLLFLLRASILILIYTNLQLCFFKVPSFCLQLPFSTDYLYFLIGLRNSTVISISTKSDYHYFPLNLSYNLRVLINLRPWCIKAAVSNSYIFKIDFELLNCKHMSVMRSV